MKIVHRQSFDHDRPFEREFRGILKFEPVSRTHDSQVDILHVGRGDGCFYYVMELADDQASGSHIQPDRYVPRTLRSELQSRSRLSLEECLRIGIALTTALEHLPSHGLVHRDIKPSNIVFIHGVPKLADIGLVTGVEATRSYVGTEGYLAPEGGGSPQADLYGLGKVLYEIATGKDRQQFPELPSDLARWPDGEGLMELMAVVTRACQHDPRHRYRSASAMRTDLELLQSGRSLARLHWTEARLRFVQKAGAAVTALAALIAAGWMWQARQTHRVRDLARETSRLVEQNRTRLLRARVAKAVHLMEEGDFRSALLWLDQALPLVESNPAQARLHRIRLRSLLEASPRLLHLLPQEPVARRCVFSPEGHRLLVVGLPSARVWDVRSGEPVGGELSQRAMILRAGFSPEGRRVLTQGQDGVLTIWVFGTNWRVSLGRPLKSRRFGPHWPSLQLDEAGRRLLVLTGRDPDDQDSEVELWDVPARRRLSGPFRAHSGAINGARLSADGAWIALASDQDREAAMPGTVELWEAATGRNLARFQHRGDLYLGAWSPDGRRLLTGGLAPEARVWDAANGEVVLPLMFHAMGLTELGFSPEGGLIGTASYDRSAKVWDATTGEPVIVPVAPEAAVRVVRFLHNGQQVLTAGDDGTARLVDLEPLALPAADLHDYIRALTGQELDALEALRPVSQQRATEGLRRARARHPEFFTSP